MKQVYTFLVLSLCASSISAQPVLSNGYGSLAAINGNTYQKTVSIGAGNFGNVSASANGQLFYASGANSTADKIYYIDVATNTIVDSVSMPGTGGDMSSTNNSATLFSLRGTAIYRLNPQTKAVDSLVIGNPNRVEERPGVQEAWVAADSMIYVVGYNGNLALVTTIDLTSGKFDNPDVRFTKGGAFAYKAAYSTKKIYMIDCNTKTVIDSIDTSPVGHAAVEVSTDSSIIYAANGNKVYMYSVASKMLVDSMVATKQAMNLYRHPSRQELWVVHHFDDSVTVFNENTKAVIASFDIGNDPFFLAFAPNPTSVVNLPHIYNVQLYPNPANNSLTLVMPADSKEKQLVIYNCVGRIIKVQNAYEAVTQVDISVLPPGNYSMAIYTGGKPTRVLPFIKK